jgi:Zn-dependent protease
MESIPPPNFPETVPSPEPIPERVAAATGLERPKPRSFRGRAAGAGAALIALLAKFKAVLVLLGHVKLLLTAGTMLVSILAYGSLWGFRFAAGFVALLFVHEMGHVIQLRREGVKASAPVFIPFLGAVVAMRAMPKDAFAEARVGLAGPVLGSVGAAACVVVWKATGNDIWRALAYAGFFINLFNLIPVLPLDGGRAMSAMSPVMWLAGFLVLVAVAILEPSAIFILIVVIGGLETYRRWNRYRHGSDAEKAYYKVHPLDRALVAAVYIALVALLAVGMHATYFQQSLS